MKFLSVFEDFDQKLRFILILGICWRLLPKIVPKEDSLGWQLVEFPRKVGGNRRRHTTDIDQYPHPHSVKRENNRL